MKHYLKPAEENSAKQQKLTHPSFLKVFIIFLFCYLFSVSAGFSADSEEKKILLKLEKLKKADSDESLDAIKGVSKFGQAGVPYLIPYLKDVNPDIRIKIANTLADIGPSAKVAVPALIVLLQDTTQTYSTRETAAVALREIGSVAVLDLLEAMKDAEEITANLISSALTTMQFSAIPVLKGALMHDDLEIRKLAALILGFRKSEVEMAIPLIIEIINDRNEHEYLRQLAVTSLGYYGKLARAATKPLLKISTDRSESSDLRLYAIGVLHMIEPRPKVVFSPLVKMLQDQSEYGAIRRFTAIILGSISEPIGEVVGVLVGIIKDPGQPEFVRGGAVQGLGFMESKAVSAIPELFDMLQAPGFSIHQDATVALPKIPPQGEKSDLILKSALPFFMNWLEKGNREEMVLATWAIAHIGSGAVKEIPVILEVLRKKEDIEIRYLIIETLGYIGSDEPAVLETLTALVRSENVDLRLRIQAVQSLGQIGPKAVSAIWSLSDVFRQEQSEDLEDAVGEAIEQVKPKNKEMLPDMINMLEDPHKDLREFAGFFLIAMSDNLQTEVEELSISELTTLTNGLKKTKVIYEESDDYNPEGSNLIGNLAMIFTRKLESRETDPFEKILIWCSQHKIITGIITYFVLMPLLWLALLWGSPLWILKINQALTPIENIKLSGWLGGLNLPLRVVLLINFFLYHRRVLDAWVRLHADAVRENFQSKQTVKDRAVYVNTPVVLDDVTIANLTAEHLRPAFKKQRVRLLIWGEGGSGKTTLACQIAMWALSEDMSERVCSHQMLPILIEHELDVHTSIDKSPVLRAIHGQLDDLVGKAESISEEFLEQLLKQRRLLIIVDHFSEMGDASRSKIRPELPEFQVNALIITSRTEETLGEVTKTTCKPQRITGDRLSSFMEAYLTQRGKRDLFNDSEFFEGCRKLSAMVSERKITALMAKLFAEQMILIKEGGVENELPTTVPDLMLSYLNELYHSASREELRSVQRDAKIIAWECLKENLRPAAASYVSVMQALGNENVEKRIEILEFNLHLINTIGVGQDKMRFTLDPLAEYLAAHYLVETYKEDEQFWKSFIERAGTKLAAAESVNEFILAILECWSVKGLDQKLPAMRKELDLLSEHIAP